MVAIFCSPTILFAGQGAGRMLYTAPNSAFIENTSGDSIVTVNDASGSIATLQTAINNARAGNPGSIIIINLQSNATYFVSSAGIVLGSQECLIGSGAIVKAANSSVTVPLITITNGATNVSIAGGTYDGTGANIFGIVGPASSARVNIDKVTVLNCGQDCIQLNGNGSGTFDSEMTVTRCDASGSPTHAGISIQNCTQATVVENYCHSNSVGIWMSNGGYCNIANNVCVGNSIGINCNSGNNNYVVNNTCNYNGTGIFAGGSANMIVSDLLASNSIAAINSSGSGNIYCDNLSTNGNAANFLNNGSGDDVVAYKGALSASGQNYFYPPLIDDQHNTTIVNGMGRTDLTISSTTIASVQSQYNAAVSANLNTVIVLHLNGTFIVGASPLTLSAHTCVLLNGTIQINSSTGASYAITAPSGANYISISGGTIDGGSLTGNRGIYFSGVFLFQIDALTLQNFGGSGTRVGGSDVIQVDHGSTPRIFTRCKVSGGAARGIWLATSGVKNIVSDCESTGVNEDGVDCDESTSGSLVKFCYLHDNVRYGIFIEQSASHNLALGNVCNNDHSYGIGCYNNSATPRGDTAFNSVICNAISGNGGLRNGSTGTNVVVSSHNFFFNNTLANTTIHSDLFGTQNYYSQNYLAGTSLATSASTTFFNSPDVSSNLFVQDFNSGLAAQAQNAATTNNTPVVIGQPTGLDNDKWALIPTDGGYYRVSNKKSGLAMNVSGASLSPGAPVIQFTFGSGENDQWMPTSAGNGLYYFVNRLSGLCLDVPSGATGTQLDQQIYTGAASQQFNLTLNPPGGGVQLPFFISASPASQIIIAGDSNTFNVTMATNSNFSGSVSLSLSGLPANTTSNFNPALLNGNGASTLTVTTATNAPVGVYSLTITAIGSGTTNSTTVSLIINSGVVALPGTLNWTAAGSGINWSTAQNWTNATSGGFGPPGTNNILIFTNIGTVNASALTSPGSGVVIPANINNSVDTSFAIGGLFDYANAINTSPNYHNIGIANGATLSVATNFQVGGFTQFLLGDNNVTRLTISGAGATLFVTNGGLTVSADAGSGPANDATLDLSGLDNFSMNGTQIRVGVEGSGSFHHASGIIYLAKENTLTLNSAGYSDSGVGSPNSGNPGFYIGHNGSTFGNGSQLYLGVSNSLFMDYATVGRGDKNVFVGFNTAFTNQNPSVLIRGTNGASTRVGVYVVGDGSAGAQSTVASTNDFSGGSVDALINYLCVGRGRSGNSSTSGGSGILTFNGGSINANTLAIGFIYPSGSNSPAIGTVNVNNSGVLTVNSNLFMAQAANVAGQTAFPQATLNVNGGTVQATNIAGGGGTAAINLNSGTIDLQGGQMTNISTIAIGDGISSPAQLVNAAKIASTNTIVVAANGTLAGNTFVTTPNMILNGTISPGANGIGAITNSGSTTFGAGGHFAVAVQDANGAPAAGWDFLQVSGQLNVQATNTNPFVIQLQSFANGQIDNVTNFNADTNYAWIIATAGGGITNFNANKFAVDISSFENDLEGGYFYVSANGNSLILSFTNNHPPVAGIYTLYQTPNGVAIPISTLASNWSDPDGDPVVLNDVDDTSSNGVAINFTSQFIYYTNANNVADAFFYTVGDVRTNPPAVYRGGDTQRTASGEIILIPPPPVSIAVNGNSFIFSGSNGAAGTSFALLGSTNLALPLSQWTPILTNSFDNNGNFNFTNNPDVNLPQQFYLLQFLNQ